MRSESQIRGSHPDLHLAASASAGHRASDKPGGVVGQFPIVNNVIRISASFINTNAIGGLHKVDSGEIWVAGKRIDSLDKGELARIRLHHIGFVFQAYNLIPVLTARENVEFVMEVQGVPAEQRRHRSTEILVGAGLKWP